MMERSENNMTRGDVDLVSREQKLKEKSGNVVLSDSLATFLYLLMRDYMPAGKVETLIQSVTNGAEKITFHNGYLAQYASNLADELRDGRFKAMVEALDAAFTDHARMGTPTKVPEAGTEVPAKLELTTEATDKIEKAYDRLTEEARKQAELELETGESTQVKDLTDAFNTVDPQTAYNVSNMAEDMEQTALKLKEQVIRQTIDTSSDEDFLDRAAKENDLSDPFSPVSLRKKAEAAKPQETQLQKRQREQLEAMEQSKKLMRNVAKKEAINTALLSLEALKDLVPSETVIEVAKVLRQEVEHELSVGKKVQEIKDQQVKAEIELPKPTGMFRRVPAYIVDPESVTLLNNTPEQLVQNLGDQLGKPENKPGLGSFSRGDPELQLSDGEIIFIERTDDGRKPNTQE